MNRRFFAEHIPDLGGCIALNDMESHHIRTVLRAREGELVQLLDGRGTLALARLVQMGGKREPVRCCIDERNTLAPSPRAVRLFVAPPRGKGMNQIIEQAVELGVAAIFPILCERSVSKPATRPVHAWEATARDACKQSGNPFLPTISGPLNMEDACSNSFSGLGFFGAIPDTNESIQIALPKSSSIELWIGPEGGFTVHELNMLQDRGLQALSIGRWTLRVATAVVAGLTWIQQRYPA